MVPTENSADIEMVATEWAVRVEESPLDAHEQVALDQWLTGDPRRLGAYARARAVCVHARRAKALGSAFAADIDGKRNGPAAVPFQHLSVASDDIPPLPDRMTRRRLLAWGGMATVAGGSVMLGLASRAAAYSYQTAKGEIRLVPLKDGSSVTLNTDSMVKVRYKPDANIVELISGEVLLDLVSNAPCPCIVIAGGTQVTGRGSSFTVENMASNPVTILVGRGEVTIESSGVFGRRQQIGANARAVVNPDLVVKTSAVTPTEVGRELAWREGMLVFDDTPLREAAREFARFSDVKIHFADGNIGEQTVTGYFAANNPVGFTNAVAASLGLKVDGASDGVILRR